jgi:glycerate kinase
MLTARLGATAVELQQINGVDVTTLERAGAAGGLAGGLAALGASLISGFDLVAAATGLDEAIGRADVVVTSEGRLDMSTLDGKVVASLVSRVPPATDAIVIAGSVEPAAADRLTARHQGRLEIVSLVATVGEAAARRDTAAALRDVLADVLGRC